MGESIRRLLKSKRSILALVTLICDAAVFFGLRDSVDPEMIQFLVGAVTLIGSTLIAGRSVSDHGEAQAALAFKTLISNNHVAPPPSEVDTNGGGDGDGDGADEDSPDD